MSIIEINDARSYLKPGETIAGLDLGTKTIGIAISDIGLHFANPRPVLKRTKFSKDAELLIKTMENEKAGIMVIGLPFNMDGSSGPRVQSTRTFVQNMSRLTYIPFVFWDERLSTVAAERSLIDMDISRSKRAERIDSAAAAFILQGALDRLALLS